MPKWEYLHEVRLLSGSATLDQRGQEGWELVAIERRGSEHELTWKRPRQPSATEILAALVGDGTRQLPDRYE